MNTRTAAFGRLFSLVAFDLLVYICPNKGHAMNNQMIDWVDTGSPDASIHFARFKGHDDRFLVIRSEGDVETAMKLRQAGFVRVFNYYFRRQPSTTLAEMRRFFPKASIRQMPIQDTRMLIQDEMPDLISSLPKADAPLAVGAKSQKFEMLNDHQVKYQPASRGGTPIAAIPIDLAEGTMEALERVRERRGDIDEWLRKELHFKSLEALWKAASPEQVDAVALSIDNALEGSGTICADATGLGKGRIGALLFRWCALNGRLFVFLTEKANLFTDFIRDVIDTDSLDLMGTPYLMNNNAKILDQATNEVMFRSLRDKDNADVIRAKKLPKGTTMVMATYSQLNRKDGPKSKFFMEICKGAHIHEDEAHNAAGEDSNTNAVVNEAEAVAASFSWSSATYAKSGASFQAYRPVLPTSIATMENLTQVLTAGGVPLLEALSRMLAATGRLIRREHDLSDMEIKLEIDHARKEEHDALSDSLAPILSEIARLSMDISGHLEEKSASPEAQKAREVYYSVHWGTRFSTLIQAFIASCKVEFGVERAVAALLDNKKPVFVFQNTMEQIVKELMTDAETGELRSHLVDPDGTERVPEFKDVLRLLVDRTMTARMKKGKDDPVTVEIEDEDLQARAEDIRRLLDSFPSLPLNPMDEILRRVEEEGRKLHEKGVIERPWVVGEISARSTKVTPQGVQQMEEVDRNVTINNFQNGQIDFLALTNAASTGLSLHENPRAKDRRIRWMFEYQIPSNPVSRIQFWGRIKRRGGTTEPLFSCLATAMSIELRTLAAQNRKVREVSANVAGSGDAGLSLDVPDPINSLGNKIAKRVLQENSRMAQKMGISLKIEDEDAEAELYFVNRLLSRLALLRTAERDAIYYSFMDAYEDALRDLTAKGMHPTRPRELPGVWRVAHREEFTPENPLDGPVFGAPIYLTTIEREEYTAPIDRPALIELIKARRERETEAKKLRDTISEHLKTKLPDLQKAALPKRFKSVIQAVTSSERNMVQIVTERVGMIRNALREVSIGGDIVVSDEAGASIHGVIVGFRVPNDVEDYDKSGSYFIEYLIPGDETPRRASLATLANDEKFKMVRAPASFQKRYEAFADLPRGQVTRRRMVLDGNPFMAAKLAVERDMGAVTRINMEGEGATSSVLIPLHKHDRIQDMPGVTTDVELAMRLIEAGGEIYSNASSKSESMLIERDGPQIKLTIPGKKSLAKLFEVPAITAITGEFKGNGSRKYARIDPEAFYDLAEAMARRGMGLNYGPEWRSTVFQISEELTAEEAEQARPAA